MTMMTDMMKSTPGMLVRASTAANGPATTAGSIHGSAATITKTEPM